MEKVEQKELQGSWRMLTGSVLYEAVSLVRRGDEIKSPSEKKDLEAAKSWLEGGNVGLITFNECCDSIKMNPAIVREKIMQLEGKAIRKPAFKRSEAVYAAYQQWQTREAEESQACSVS
jgi:hypothetical protein